MDEKEQTTLGKEEKETRPFYKCVKSRSGKGFVNELNKAQENGYKPIWDSREIKKDMGTEPPTIVRTVMVYDTEAIGIQDDEKSKRMQIIDATIKAEDYLYRKKSLLDDRETFLIDDINWDELNTTRKEEGKLKITNEKLRQRHMKKDKDYKQLLDEVHEAESWLITVKKYAELHELPNGKAPWIVEEEKQSMPMAEKVQDTPPKPTIDPNMPLDEPVKGDVNG